MAPSLDAVVHFRYHPKMKGLFIHSFKNQVTFDIFLYLSDIYDIISSTWHVPCPSKPIAQMLVSFIISP